MNRQSLGALVVLNLVLLVSLVVVAFSPEPAVGQVGVRGDYVMISGQVAGRADRDAIYLMEFKSGRMAVITYDSRNGKFDVLGARVLTDDLKDRGRVGR